jgi:LMBR1 domain-containing protein 1
MHMILYTIPLVYTKSGFTPFLNTALKAMDSIPFLGVAFYAMFSFYLLACVVKGVTKVGQRGEYISIHPIAYGDTYMDSMLFNTGIILTSSLAVAQYCTISFSEYATSTASQCMCVVVIW